LTGGELMVTVATSPSIVRSATGLMAAMGFLRRRRDQVKDCGAQGAPF
jgi:hypothetical protein